MRSLFHGLFDSPFSTGFDEDSSGGGGGGAGLLVLNLILDNLSDGFPYDSVTGAKVSCNISGVRYGLVNGLITSFNVNIPPVETKGLRGCYSFSQLAPYTENLANTSFREGFITPVLVDTFQGKDVYKFAENTTPNIAHEITQVPLTGVLDNSVIGGMCVFKASGRSRVRAAIRTKAEIVETVYCNLSTGTLYNNTGGIFSSVQDMGSGYYRFFAACNIRTGSGAPQILFRTINDADENLYAGDGVSGVLVCHYNIINFGVNGIPFIPTYTPNITGNSISVVSETSTSTTGTSFDLDDAALSRLKTGLRGPNAQGHIELEVESNVDSGWLANNTFLNILSINNNNINGIVYKKDGSGTSTFKGIDSVISDCSVTISGLTVGQTYRISLDYGTYTDGTQKMRLTVNGVKSGVVAFSGSFGTQDLRFFYDNTVHAGWIKNLSYSEKPLW